MASNLSLSRRLAKLAISTRTKKLQQLNASIHPSMLHRMTVVGGDYPAHLSGVRFQSGGDKKDDPFGLEYKDSKNISDGNIGDDEKNHPPLYTRDVVTGKFTGEIEAELKDEDRELLHLSQVEKERALTSRFVSNVLASEDDNGSNKQLSHAAQRIREESMVLNVLGRKVSDIKEVSKEQDDDDGVSAPLSSDEIKSLKSFLEKEHGKEEARNMLEAENLLARQSTKNNQDDSDDQNPDLDLTWMTPEAQRDLESLGYFNLNNSGTDSDADDPFANLMPSDLNPARKVNRRNAESIPKSLLHHNNLSLLRRYVTPGGQIMNRVQSRLSAKDQRKISKLIKRARHLGLIPYMGQWKVEDTGNIHEENLLTEDLEWEKELIQRGVIKRSSSIWEKEKKSN